MEDGSQPKMDPFNFVWILIKETDRSTFSIVNFSENNHENIWCIKEAGVCVWGQINVNPNKIQSLAKFNMFYSI